MWYRLLVCIVVFSFFSGSTYAEDLECSPETIPQVTGAYPETVINGQITNMFISGQFATYEDSVGRCAYYQDGVQIGTAAASRISPTQIICPLTYGLTEGEVQVGVTVYRASATEPGLNSCSSNNGTELDAPGEYASFTIVPEQIECSSATMPFITGVSPDTVEVGDTPVMKLAGHFTVFDDTVARCGYSVNGNYHGYEWASSIGPRNIECPLKPGLEEGDAQITVTVYRTSAVNPYSNSCSSNNGGYADTFGEFAAVDIVPETAECLPYTMPYVTGVWPSRVDIVEPENITVSGSFAVHDDTVAQCHYHQNGDYVGAREAVSVTEQQIVCPLSDRLERGEAQVDVTVYRSSADRPSSNYCSSAGGGYLDAPGEFASFAVEDHECTAETTPYISGIIPTSIALGHTDSVKVSGNFTVYDDSLANCYYRQGESYLGFEPALSLAEDQIECPVISSLSEGETLLTVQVYRASAVNPNLNLCASNMGGNLDAPGEFGIFTIHPLLMPWLPIVLDE